MSSIRIYLLGSLAEHGPMHGHGLRLLAAREHTHLWTDITVGGIYGAMKRLAAEGKIQEVRTERAGHRPERQIYEITEAGRRALGAMSLDTLREFTLRPDPFDLALTRAIADAVELRRPRPAYADRACPRSPATSIVTTPPIVRLS